MKHPLFGIVFAGGGLLVTGVVAVRWWEGRAPFGELMFGVLFAMPFLLTGVWMFGLHERFGWRREVSDASFGGSLAILIGVLILAGMLRSPASSFHVPRWTAYLAALIFPIAGVIVIVSAVRGKDHPVIRVLVSLLVTSLAIVGWAVTFEATGATMSIAGFTAPAGWLGNVVFGFGAVITSAIAISLWVWTFKGIRGQGGTSA